MTPLRLALETDERDRLPVFHAVRESLDRSRRLLAREVVAIARLEVRLVLRGVVCVLLAEPLHLEGLLALFGLREERLRRPERRHVLVDERVEPAGGSPDDADEAVSAGKSAMSCWSAAAYVSATVPLMSDRPSEKTFSPWSGSRGARRSSGRTRGRSGSVSDHEPVKWPCSLRSCSCADCLPPRRRASCVSPCVSPPLLRWSLPLRSLSPLCCCCWPLCWRRCCRC